MSSQTGVSLLEDFFVFLLPARLYHQLANVLVERIVGHQLLNVEVHAVAPIVARIGRNVDALGIGIGQS